MKATVIKAFYDLQDPNRTTYQVGSVFEGTTERVKGLEDKGYVKAEKVAEKPTAKPTEKVAKPQPTKRAKKG